MYPQEIIDRYNKVTLASVADACNLIVGHWTYMSCDVKNQINDALAQMMFESGAGPVSGRWAALMGGDLKEFNRLPGQMQDKVQIGVQRGISGLRVTIDGQVAGRILAPYVSQEIARGAQ